MSNKKPTPSDDFVVIPDVRKYEIDHDIHYKIDRPIRESIIPSMQAPEDWPPPPDVDKEKSGN
jgi:hypothetical protein